jgi:hypothetical protein
MDIPRRRAVGGNIIRNHGGRQDHEKGRQIARRTDPLVKPALSDTENAGKGQAARPDTPEPRHKKFRIRVTTHRKKPNFFENITSLFFII